MPDRIADARSLLLADAPVAAIVGTDIETARWDGAIPATGLLLRRLGNTSQRIGTPMREQSMEARAYAASAADAWDLWEATRTALVGDPVDQTTHETKLRSFGLWQVLEELDGADLPVDPQAPDDGVYVVFGNFTLISRDDA